MNWDNPTSFRLYPDKEQDLIQFIEAQGGTKTALKILFFHYQNTKDLQQMLRDYFVEMFGKLDVRAGITETKIKEMIDNIQVAAPQIMEAPKQENFKPKADMKDLALGLLGK